MVVEWIARSGLLPGGSRLGKPFKNQVPSPNLLVNRFAVESRVAEITGLTQASPIFNVRYRAACIVSLPEPYRILTASKLHRSAGASVRPAAGSGRAALSTITVAGCLQAGL
jgi:hypothetical protein